MYPQNNYFHYHNVFKLLIYVKFNFISRNLTVRFFLYHHFADYLSYFKNHK